MISMIAAMDRNRNIGFDGDMPWGKGMKADLKRFKDLTDGKTIIMGRKTFESLPGPLSNRFHIVLSNQDIVVKSPAALVANNFNKVLDLALKSNEEIFVIGGAQIYEQFLPHADKIYLTKVLANLEGDTKFPEITGSWKISADKYGQPDENNPYGYTFFTYERV